jgi:enoyl-CoA hydratase
MSGPYDDLLVETSDAVAVVVINRPHKRNALRRRTIAELRLLVDAIATDEAVRAVVLRGAGERALSAGADVSEVVDHQPSLAQRLANPGRGTFDALERLPKPVIAAIQGFALGGGLELAMACDLRVAGRSAVFGQPEVTLGGVPGWGATERLPRLVGIGRAKELLFLGDRIGAEEALHIGLVNRVVPDDQVMAETMRLAHRLAALPSISLALIKNGVHAHGHHAHETLAVEVARQTSDQGEGVAALRESRPPNFQGR